MAHKKQKKTRTPIGHEMHKYTSLLTSTVSDSKSPKDKCSDSRNEKYSLRERQKRRHVMANIIARQKHQNNRGAGEVPSILGVKSINCNSGKSKAPPLSKYRRKTANARERTRMREINTAFETLRNCVPQVIAGDDAGVTNEKLTKITTLRLAMKYISLLTELLKSPDFTANFPLDFLDHAQYNGTERTTAGDEELASLTETKKQVKIARPTAKPSADKAGQQDVRKAPKRLSKKRKLANSEHYVDIISTVASSASCSSTTSASTFSTSSDSTTRYTASPSSCSSSHPLDNTVAASYSSSSHIFQSMSALNNLVLESDGESLHLSEHCLSPVQDKYAHLFSSSDSNHTDDISITKKHISSDLYVLESPLELNMQMMESSPNSIDFSMEPPTACMSPLAALDTFGPFGDFLPDYPEHTSLDLFLT